MSRSHLFTKEKGAGSAQVSIIALALSVSLLIGVTFAWETHNRRVERNGMAFRINSTLVTGMYTVQDNEVVQPQGDRLTLELTYPGSEADFYIGVVNQTAVAVNIRKLVVESMDDINEMETPIHTEDGEDLYFGTQLQMSVTTYYRFNEVLDPSIAALDRDEADEIIDISQPLNPYLLTENAATDVWGDVASASAGELNVAYFDDDHLIRVGPDQAVIFHIVIRFVNNAEKDQKAFANFGTSPQFFKRNIRIVTAN